MKPNIIYNIIACLAVLISPVMVSCSSQDESLLDEDAATASLCLNIGPVGQVRAGTAGLPDNEKMRSLRVVILHENGTVEHNRFYAMDSAQEEKYIFLKVSPGETKKIFLFVNEESVPNVEGVTGDGLTLSAFFGKYQIGAAGFETDVNNIYFIPDYSGGKPIPMSSMYEIDVPDKGVVEETFYVVRSATKFTFCFKNFRDGAVKVNSISVSDIAEKSYLMPHKQQLTMDFKEEDGTTIRLFWIDWLKRVSDESQLNLDDTELADRRGWIMDYDIPSTNSFVATQYAPQEFYIPPLTTEMGTPKPGLADFPSFYLPESKHLKAQDKGAYSEQAYTMSFSLTDEDQKTQAFNFPFENLRALFRNTNVVVNVTLSDKVIVDVIPYSEIILDPVFGL